MGSCWRQVKGLQSESGIYAAGAGDCISGAEVRLVCGAPWDGQRAAEGAAQVVQLQE